MNIPVHILKKIDSISALKVLVCFCDNSNDSIIKLSISQICTQSGLVKNSVKKGLLELIELGFISKLKQGQYSLNITGSKNDTVENKDRSNIDPVSKNDPSENPVKSSFKLSIGSKIDREQDTIYNNKYINNINNIDFNNININIFFNKDINSQSLVNANMYLTEKELGSLAKRVFDWSLPMLTLNGKKDNRWFGMQLKVMKELLFRWRTEQVLASIMYWTTINPPANGISSLIFLKYKGKIEKSLDYFKTEYISNAHEYNKNDLVDKIVKAKEEQIKHEEQRQLAREQAKEMKNMSEEKATEVVNDIMSDILGGIKLDFGRKTND